MTFADVIDFYNTLENLKIKIWLDGGWGVDALLGKQTRPHQDLDIFVQQQDVKEVHKLLETRGFKEIKLEIARPYNFVLGDDKGHEIDFHVVVFDNSGNIKYGLPPEEEVFPAEALEGNGAIEGYSVRCTSPSWIIKWHTGYKPRETDFQDVSAICEKFGMDYPPGYTHLKK